MIDINKGSKLPPPLFVRETSKNTYITDGIAIWIFTRTTEALLLFWIYQITVVEITRVYNLEDACAPTYSKQDTL